MEETAAARYWCYVCSQVVNPIDIEVEIKCPLCESGFVEEIGGTAWDRHRESGSNFRPGRVLSLSTPILLGMMREPRRRRRLRHLESYDDDDEDENEDGESRHEGDTELDREIESNFQRRRRNSATILRLLQNIRAGMASEYESGDRNRDTNGDGEGDGDGDGDRDRGRDRDRDRDRDRAIGRESM